MIHRLSRFASISSVKEKHLLRDLFVVLVIVVLGMLVASLIVDDKWKIAAVMIFSIPVIILLQHHPFLAIPVWLVLTPFLMRNNTTSSDMRQVYWVIHRFLPLLTLLMIVLPSAIGMKSRHLPRLGFPEWMMTGYVVISIVSIWLNNPEPLASTYLFYDRVIVPMFLYLIVRLSRPDEHKIRWLVPVTFFIAISQSAIGVLSWFVPHLLPSQWVDHENQRTIGTLVNSYAYVTTLVLASFLVLHYGMQSSSKRIRTLSILTFLISAYCIFISFSRSGWLAGGLALLGLAAIYPRLIIRLGLTILPVALLVAGFYLQDQVGWARQRLYAEDSALSRVPAYAAAVRMFADRPLTGWGYGNFDLYNRKFQNPPVFGTGKYTEERASHNLFLTVIAEQGLIGIVFFLAPLVYWLGLTLKRFSQLPKYGFWSRNILVIFWMVLVSHIVVYSFTNMRIVYVLGAWWLALGLIARFMDAHQPAPEAEPSRLVVFPRAASQVAKSEGDIRS